MPIEPIKNHPNKKRKSLIFARIAPRTDPRKQEMGSGPPPASTSLSAAIWPQPIGYAADLIARYGRSSTGPIAPPSYAEVVRRGPLSSDTTEGLQTKSATALSADRNISRVPAVQHTNKCLSKS